MKREFEAYLKSIGLPENLRKRAGRILKFYEKVCKETIKGIFVSEYIKPDGTRAYDSLMFFSKHCVMEAHEFVSKDHYDMSYLTNRLQYWILKKQDYDFDAADTKSRLSFVARLAQDLRLEMKASSSNCDHLMEILRSFVVSNMLGNP